MGQNQIQLKQNQDYKLIEELPVGNIVKHNKTQNLHFLKQYSFTAQQAYQNALNMHSLKLANKNEHILNFLHFTTKSENSFCSSFHKIILLFEYSDYSLEKQLANRTREGNPFNQKQIWSILCSCVLACVHLVHCEGKMHSGLTAKDIRLSPNGCIKLLSHEMIGMDSSHTQSQGIPKMLAATLIQCISMEKITNQDNNYLQNRIQSLDCSRQMKQMLFSMIKNDATFLQIEEHLFKLVQDDQSLASHSNTPILKSHSPLTGSGYKCPRIIQNEASKMKSPLTGSRASFSQNISQKLSPMAPDYEDLKSYLFMVDDTNIEIQNPDQNDQDINSNQNQEDQSPHEINSFFLKQRKIETNFSQQLAPEDMKNIEKMFIKKEFQMNPIQSSRRKQNTQNFADTKIQPQKSKVQMPITSLSSNDSSLFTDPKLFSLIKSDLQQIKMRRSIDEQGKYSKRQQFTMPVIPAIPTMLQTSSFQEKNPIQNYTFIQQKSFSVQKVNQQQIKIQQTRQVESWLSEGTGKNYLASHKIDHNYSTTTNNLKQIQMIKEVSQQQREDEQQKKSSKVTVKQLQTKNHIAEDDRVSQLSRNTSGKLEEHKIQNILNDTGIGFKRKKQSTAKFEVLKQVELPASQTPHQPSNKGKQNIDISPMDTKHELKSKTVGMKPVQAERNLQSIRRQQFFNEYAPSQTSQPPSSQPSSRTSNSLRNEKAEKDTDKYIQVSEKYTRGHYEGTKLNGKRHGNGTFFYSEGGKYVGNWSENKMHGKGVLYYPNQKVAYDGEWENDQLSGYGILYNQQVTNLRTPFDYRDWNDAEEYWVKYEGHFYQDNKEGQGKLFLVNGERLEAEFHDDKVDGQGVLYRSDGTSVRGKWRQNKLIRMF